MLLMIDDSSTFNIIMTMCICECLCVVMILHMGGFAYCYVVGHQYDM